MPKGIVVKDSTNRSVIKKFSSNLKVVLVLDFSWQGRTLHVKIFFGMRLVDWVAVNQRTCARNVFSLFLSDL